MVQIIEKESTYIKIDFLNLFKQITKFIRGRIQNGEFAEKKLICSIVCGKGNIKQLNA